MVKNVTFYFVVLLLTLGVITLGYFIIVNTVLADNILPNIKLNSQDVSLLSERDLKAKVSDVALASLPTFLDVEIDGYSYKVATSTLDFKLQGYKVVNYGKGRDFIKVLSEALNAISGKVDVEVTYDADLDSLLYSSPINFNSSKPSALNGNKYECIKDNFSVELNKAYLLNKVNEGIKSGKISIDADHLILNENDRKIYIACNKYFNEIAKLQNKLKEYTVNDISNYIAVMENEDGPTWGFLSVEKENELIKNIESRKNVPAFEGEYEIVNNRIFLYKQFQVGYSVDQTSTKANLKKFLEDPNTELVIPTTETKPKILEPNIEILDFTKTLGEGKTRIDLVRNGAPNFVVAYTQYGLEEIDYHVVQSGEEFSYIDFIQPNNGKTKSGRPIAPGICNSTTTLFRAVLESGLAVTDRSYHAYYVPSYEWGYPYNIVDAAYFTDPDVDFKFKNDSDFPILIRTTFSRDSDFQYNTVKILSSSKSPDREVELTNWKIWDKFSSTNFKGSFDRIVRENGEIIKQDYFYSHYL